jgi:hypothetical protein
MWACLEFYGKEHAAKMLVLRSLKAQMGQTSPEGPEYWRCNNTIDRFHWKPDPNAFQPAPFILDRSIVELQHRTAVFTVLL